jgi:hypothetical protein
VKTETLPGLVHDNICCDPVQQPVHKTIFFVSETFFCSVLRPKNAESVSAFHLNAGLPDGSLSNRKSQFW